MNNIYKNILRIIIFGPLAGILFSSCQTNGTDPITSDYKIAWSNVQRSRALYKKNRIVPPYVYAAGLTERFIVIKQHPLKDDHSPDTDSICFYIVEISGSKVQDKPVYGPLDGTAFDSLSNVLGITDAPFDREYPIGLHWKLR